MSATVELNETNYCDQESVSIDFTFEEHDFLMDVLTNMIDTFNVMGAYSLPSDSDAWKKYEMLTQMKDRIVDSWVVRFENAPYDNN